MKNLFQYICEAAITQAFIKKVTKGLNVEIEKFDNGDWNIIFDEDDYWDFEEDDLTPRLKEIFDQLSTKAKVTRWDDRNWLMIRPNATISKPEAPKQVDPHKKQANGLTPHDEDLIDMCTSTTYRDTIENAIKSADTAKAKKILKDILNNPDMRGHWEN